MSLPNIVDGGATAHSFQLGAFQERVFANNSLSPYGAYRGSPIAKFFATGMQGAWFEESDQSTLYPDSKNLSAIAPGNAVSLNLSKDQSLSRSSVELINNPNFSNFGNNWAIGGADATHIATFPGTGVRYQSDTTTPQLTVSSNIAIPVNKWLELTVNVIAWTSGSVKVLEQAGWINTIGPVGTYKGIVYNQNTNFGFSRASANVDLTIGSVSLRELAGNHARQLTAGLQPIWQQNPSRLVYDGVDDLMTVTFPAALGANCTVGYAIPGSGFQILTGQNIGTTFNLATTACAVVILNGPLDTLQTSQLQQYLNAQLLK